KLFSRLEQAAASGIRVQAIFDGFGSLDFLNTHHRMMAESDVQTRIFHPLPWSAGYFNQFMRLPKAWLDYFFSANRRNHRKLMITDNTNVMVGSQNISIRSLEWFETSILMKLENASQFSDSFQRVWARSRPLNRAAK